GSSPENDSSIENGNAWGAGSGCRVRRPVRALQTAQLARSHQARPVEVRAGVLLAPRRDVAMPGDPAQGMPLRQPGNQAAQAPILGRVEAVLAVTLEFHTDREIVAALAPKEARHPGMPGP